MATVRVNYNQIIGKIKPVHGVGQPPFAGVNFSMFSYLTDAHIPFARLHDVGGFHGGNLYVDIPNLFRDFSADPTDPAAYDFTFTDLLITALMESGVEPFFRLGVSIENYAKIKAYRIFPPADYHKWAVICEYIIRHYTEGWADGFHYDIRYWEIWNEPDNYEEINENQMWQGTKEQFYELYDVASKHLKACFPHLKIGGYASCGFYELFGEGVALANSSPRHQYFIEFFNGFLDYIQEHDCPLDFFSWHSYADVKCTEKFAAYARQRLDEAGYTATEHTCNEWNPHPEKRGTLFHAAQIAAELIMMQHSSLDSAMFYDARCKVGTFSALFYPGDKTPFPAYYGFKAFGQLYVRGIEVQSTCDNEDVYVAAATGDAGDALMIVNASQEDVPLNLELGGKQVVSCKAIDETHMYEDMDLPATLGANTILYLELQ